MKQPILKFVSIVLALVMLIGLGTIGPSALAKIRTETSNAVLSVGELGTVEYVIDGDGFILDDGLKVKLSGIEAPQRAWPEKNRAGFPLAEDAKEYLEKLINGKRVALFYGGKTRDRYGRALAHAWLLDDDGNKQTWLQEAMVKAGYARVYTWPGHIVDTETLYAAEREARKTRRGIWNNRRTKSFYKIKKPDPNPLAQHVDSLQIIEGIIVSTANVKGTIYLNFGSDYKTDFTVGIGKKHVKLFAKTGIDPVNLEGARVRVRGWLELQNGPMIWMNDPRRLEIIE